MRYCNIDKFEYVNGSNIGVSLFVQGCPFHCKGCFNSETWDFNGGKEWTKEVEDKFLDLVSKPYIKRVSILGGEPLATQNVYEVLSLVEKIRERFPDKTVWIYSGYTWETIFDDDKFDVEGGICENQSRRAIILLADVFVDGQFVDELKDLSLKFRGSSNQRLIDVPKTIDKGEIVLWK